MKIRNDFVTNSSSSSYICDICGNDVSGYDVTLSDYNMGECVHEHIFCYDHMMLDDISFEQAKQIIKNALGSYNQFDVDSFSNKKTLIEEFFELYHGRELPEEFCPICSFKEISNDDLNKFKNVKLNKTDDEIKNEIKNKFKNFKELEQCLEDFEDFSNKEK